jgi:hypothetical protein
VFKDKHNRSNAFEEDPFNRFMFGTRKRMDEPVEKEKVGDSFLEKVNLEELLDHVDLLMSSAKQLKPLVRKLSPFVQQFINKD